MIIAGLDLGASCGYALLTADGYRVASSTWKLGKRSGSSYQRFEELLEKLFLEGVSAVGYEKVRRHRGVEAAHAYGAYEALVLKACYNAGVPDDRVIRVTVQQIKRCATDNGQADKDDVEAAAMTRWAYVPEDSNDADALWCAEVTRQLLHDGII
jgi:Holliday junction resolvasome RuvABC endonuclease subunit